MHPLHPSPKVQWWLSWVSRSAENPKLLHSYIRNKKVGRPVVGPIMLPSGELSDDACLMAETLADSFSAVYTKDLPNSPAQHQVFDGFIENLPLSVDTVLRALQGLDGNSAMGPDGLHPVLLKAVLFSFLILFTLFSVDLSMRVSYQMLGWYRMWSLFSRKVLDMIL